MIPDRGFWLSIVLGFVLGVLVRRRRLRQQLERYRLRFDFNGREKK